jgi:multisubunit Na+/H+ antiporter MnhC subunit
MRRDHPESLLLIGFFLVLLGMVLPVLMVLQIIETTFFLSFVSWGSTVGCLFLGWIGAAHYVRVRKK